MTTFREWRAVIRWCTIPMAAVIGLSAGGAVAQPSPDLTLTGILLGPTPVAIIEDGEHTFITKVGEPVGDAMVTAILPDKVVLKRGRTSFELQPQSGGRASRGPAVAPNSVARLPGVQPLPVLPTGQPLRAPVQPGVRKELGSPPAPRPRNPVTIAPVAGMMLTGILGAQHRVAILEAGGQSFVAAAGDWAGDAVVVSVLPGKVVLKRDGAVFELTL